MYVYYIYIYIYISYIRNLYEISLYIYGRRINCKTIIAANSFMCVITIFQAIQYRRKLSYIKPT